MSNIVLRPGRVSDAKDCGRICFEAFKNIAEEHGFPPDIPTVDAAVSFVSSLLETPGFYSVVAEEDGRVVGSNFLDERNVIAGIGPITVDPMVQNKGVGKQLMKDVLSRAENNKFPGIRLVQAAYHMRSLGLYTKLGFVTRETLSVMQGASVREAISGCAVREARESDIANCNRICWMVHGIDRGRELKDSIAHGHAVVVERDGKIRGYSSGLAFFGHSVAKTNEDLMAIIGSGREYQRPGIIIPSRNHELFRWCLNHGLRVTEQLTLMTIGLYNEPTGAYLPSILF
ncbi:MAG: GNAT family N-acetyltransferase [Nitrososphaerota archaeon]|nr:GNAT family N-acetyltransferase [Nitrososphaerota archaeon]MDG6923217.1 GNAT family N-acetyltransferase [Nitrososphaerota archaeon]